MRVETRQPPATRSFRWAYVWWMLAILFVLAGYLFPHYWLFELIDKAANGQPAYAPDITF